MINKKKLWLVIVGTSILLVVLILACFAWIFNRLELVNAGMANPVFPYKKYSQADLNKMYPQYVNENVATTRTPEETHRLFVDKLKAGDLDGAVECCFVKEDWVLRKEGLLEVKNSGYLDQMILDLDTQIEPEFVGDTLSSYNYFAERDGKLLGSIIEFQKNEEGVWLMKKL